MQQRFRGCMLPLLYFTAVQEPAEHTGQSVEHVSTDFGRDRWLTTPEAVAYGLADEVIGGSAGAPESGTPA